MLQKLKHQRAGFILLFFMLVTDVAFIVMHLLHCFSKKVGEASPLLLDAEYGYPERFQFLKYTIIIILVGAYILKKKWFSFVPLFLLFALLFLDDLFQWHRWFGAWLHQFFHLQGRWNFTGTNVGYMLYALLLGIFCLVLILIGVQKSSERLKGYYKIIFFLLSAFFVFGFGVDVLSQAMGNDFGAVCFLTIIEEGGEMIILSLLVGYLVVIGKDSQTKDK